MRHLAVIAAAFAACMTAAAAQQFGPAQFNIKDDDGYPISNYSLNAAQLARVEALSGKVAVGNMQGDVTILQFYDLNCPFCREAAADVDALVRADNKLKLVFVPYAVLSVPSVQGAMIEIAAGKMLSPGQFLDFHRRIYAGRGRIDGPRVMAVAKDMGLDEAKVAQIANTEATLDILRENVTAGGDAGLKATPAYVIGGVAILGHPGLKPLQQLIGAMRACGKAVC
jgi:protein-disulfide isomerase